MEKLLFTGASGFLGTNIMPILKQSYDVKTLGVELGNDYSVNLSQEIPSFNETFDIVLHAAGKAHIVPKTEKEKQLFFDINLQGTKNLCSAFERNNKYPKSIIFISTVAVYGCDAGINISEKHPLDGNTPYAQSKLQAEYFLQSWCEKSNVVLTILRPPLLAGKNPVGNLGAMVKGIKNNMYLSVGKGDACKGILMAEDIANIIPYIYDKGGIYNICDDSNPSFRDLENLICLQLNKNLPLSIPLWFAKIIARFGDHLGSRFPLNTIKLNKITKSLTFDNTNIKEKTGWRPINVLKNFKIQ